MKKDLIDRNALKEHIGSYAGMFTDELGFAVSMEAVLRGIDFAHAVDAVEVVHGEWEKFEDDYNICATEFTCSNCKESFCSSELTDGEFVAMMRFCPNCGAKMDGVRREDG